MIKYPINVGLCGFGGQGIILSAVILGTTAVTKSKLFAVQTQSYGSEARGGQCQAELILDSKPINSPVASKKNLLIALFQDAYDKYYKTLEADGILIVDPKLVTKYSRNFASTFEVPATEIATNLGNRLVANMVILGFLSEKIKLVSTDDLIFTVRELVNERFLTLDLKAIDEGVKFAKTGSI